MKTSVLALGLVLTSPPHGLSRADTPEPSVVDEDLDEPQSEETALPPGPLAVDVVLPSGLRVIAARDATLPVAAVILALETGTEDDPSDRPGLVHALGYHLLQGNRELPPEGVARMAHDGGGVTSMAIGPAQIRYEALVPVSLLDDLVWAESQRLRSPNVDDDLWRDSLGWARRDARRTRALPPAVVAALHGADGLAHAGRSANAEVQALQARDVARELAERMSYARATLVVVSPVAPAMVLERVREAFADLPERPRQVHDRFSHPRSSDGPRRFALPEANGSTLAWPVPPGSEELELARILCRVINRQRRVDPEPERARLRCHLDEDPRRATLVVRASGVDDALELARARLRRIFEGDDQRLLEQQAEIVTRAYELELSTPLGLARRLAGADPRAPTGAHASAPRPLTALTGLDVVRSTSLVEHLAERYPLETGMQIVAAEEP